MKSKLTIICTFLIVTAIVGTLTVTMQQAAAPRSCAGCTAFKKLTHEFEKNVIEAATVGNSDTIPGLLEQYSEDVRALDLTPRG